MAFASTPIPISRLRFPDQTELMMMKLAHPASPMSPRAAASAPSAVVRSRRRATRRRASTSERTVINRKSDATPPRRLRSIHRTTVASCPGTKIANRYRIVSLVGQGGMGEVYRADDLKLGHTVALKFLPKDLANDPRRLQLFHDEVRLARQISHPNVCRVHDIGEMDGQHFLSMEYH